MNQIIVVKPINKKIRNFFRIQLTISISIVILMCIFYAQNWRKRQEKGRISEAMNQAFKLETVYSAQKDDSKNQYFGKITIPKIKLEYTIFNECNDELLKILPCKFYGGNIKESGNIGIAGHNFDDNRFFGNLNQLKKGDTIYLEDQNGAKYQYRVYDKYKVNPDDFECLKATKKYDLTLVTCDNLNQKRLVVKASR